MAPVAALGAAAAAAAALPKLSAAGIPSAGFAPPASRLIPAVAAGSSRPGCAGLLPPKEKPSGFASAKLKAPATGGGAGGGTSSSSGRSGNVSFVFDRCFSPGSQAEICQAVAAPLVAAVVGGVNATLFAYGQTGSGKTYTMEGPAGQEGCVQFATAQLFAALPAGHAVQYQYVQLYNDEFLDLLDPPSTRDHARKKLSIEEGKRFVCMRGATVAKGSSPGAMLEDIKRGASFRATGATNMNDASSRSHAILIVVCAPDDPSVSLGEAGAAFYLVDLAGSERTKRSGVQGKAFDEAAAINKALSALGRVVTSLVERDGQRASHISYKDNPLTQLLKSGLGGNSKTCLVACITSASDSIDESLNTLRFATQARHVKNKVAKKRLDKFYYLAKERGYRSRAAFKLLQLDKKYDFLSKARGVLDLCAAPGSWMQVARQHMPSTAPCIGIDLATIKPINKCVGLQEDITTQKCRSAIRHQLKEHKVDVVLHDGAPNVGTAWLQDAFGQNELTLHALRLACDFMQPGGTFVTKAFRSQDYNSLLFVFEQLFRRVEATKPSASRNESAEIFVVCQGFPKAAIDPKFLDPKDVFKEMEVAVDESTNVLQRKKGFKAPAVGYSQNGKQLLTSDLSVSDFVTGAAPVKALGEHNCLVWDDSPECEAWRGMAQTTSALYEACNDLKVLGKKDFRMLLTWRLKAAELWRKLERANGGGGKKGRGEEGSGEEESGEEGSDKEGGEEAAEATIDGELTELERLAAQRKKAAKRKESEKRRRMRERLSLQMEHPGDRLDFGEDLELFSLNKIKSAKALKKLGYDASADFTAEDDEREDDGKGMGDDGESDDEEDYIAKLDRELNAMYADFQSRSKRRAEKQ